MNTDKIETLAQIANLLQDLVTSNMLHNIKLTKKTMELITEIEAEIKSECK